MGYISDDTRKVTTHRLVEMKQRGEKISMLTSYDYTMAQIVDGAGVDVILVGDSASNVMAGNVTTLPITLDQMIYHGKSVVRGVKRAMVIVDMPFGSYQGNELEGLASAIRIMKESHADALKLEGGEEIIGTVKRILSAGIPIMGHLGLMPQSINKYGTYTVRAKDDAEAEKLVRDAHLLEEAGCFGLVLEKIPAALAARVASELTIPVIGIGAGGDVDGQVLVVQDMLGMNNGFRPRFLRRYADLHTVMTESILLLLSRDVLWLAIPSVAIGIGGACRAGKLWASQFSDVVPFPIGGYILVGCLLLLFIVATVVLKAWCIANENPVKSIKSE
jgi:3-methyl-2-oxobutanoate hydroxymethyltransferase